MESKTSSHKQSLPLSMSVVVVGGHLDRTDSGWCRDDVVADAAADC